MSENKNSIRLELVLAVCALLISAVMCVVCVAELRSFRVKLETLGDSRVTAEKDASDTALIVTNTAEPTEGTRAIIDAPSRTAMADLFQAHFKADTVTFNQYGATTVWEATLSRRSQVTLAEAIIRLEVLDGNEVIASGTIKEYDWEPDMERDITVRTRTAMPDDISDFHFRFLLLESK